MSSSYAQSLASYSKHSNSQKQTLPAFVRTVFSIMTLELFFLVVCTIFAGKYIGIRRFFLRHTVLTIFMLIIAILSAASLRTGVFYKQFPTNYIILAVFNISLSYVVCRVSYMFPPQFMLTFSVLLLSILTGLTLYLSNIDRHLNFKSALLTSLGSAIVGGILMFTFYQITFMNFLICGCLIMFLAAHIIYGTDLILKQRRKSVRTDDEVMGAISYVTDIVGVWKHLLDDQEKQPNLRL